MTKDLEEKVKAIVEALKVHNSGALFGDKYEQLDKACVTYLKARGGDAILPDKQKFKIYNIDTLIEFFYLLCMKRLRKQGISFYKNNIKIDRRTASLFVKSLMETYGFSKEVAIQKAAEIIETVFLNIEDFKFKTSLSFSIFGQKNFSWVTEKAQLLISLRKKKEEVLAYEKMLEDGDKWLEENFENMDIKFDD